MRRPDRRGFTLVELLIVVAIIGILAAIAIPNFQRFQAKSRQAEARINLGSIFSGQMAFFSLNSRFGTFSEIGFYSSEERARIYTYTDGVDVQPGKAGAQAYPGAIVAVFDSTGFTATAAGTIANNGLVDGWYVNDRRDIVNEVNGT